MGLRARHGRTALLLLSAGYLLYRARAHRAAWSLFGQTVVITGGSRGLGFAIARRAVDAGARVAICGRDAASLGRAHRALQGGQGQALALTCDVTDRAAVDAMLSVVRDLYGPVDLLVTCAGVIAVGPLASLERTEFERTVDVNFGGTVHPTLAVLPEMRQRGAGRIAHISSIGGKVGVPHLAAYSASKFAVAGFSEALRAEVAAEGVHVTTIFPGLMRTGSPRHARFTGDHRAEHAWFTVGDSLPLVSVDAERAAARILLGCQRGEAEIVFPLAARAAVLGRALAPGAAARVLSIVNRLLPQGPAHPTPARSGADSASRLAPSALTALTNAAERRYNQLPDAAVPAAI